MPGHDRGTLTDTSNIRPRVSVIIPVLDDAARLELCLVALGHQSLREPIEILVVDNGSCDDPESVTRAHPEVRLLHEPRRSSYAARNLGARSARGAILAFTDSDCAPAKDWLELGIRRLEESAVPAFVGGRVSTFPARADRPTGAELYEIVHAFPQRSYMHNLSFSVTANMLVYRTVFAQVGEFDSTLQSSGDREWGERAQAAGVRPIYAEDVRVAHPARRTLAEMLRKNRRRFEGDVRMRQLREAPPAHSLLLRIRPPLRSTVRNLGLLSPPTVRSKVLYSGARLAVHYMNLYIEARASDPHR